MLGLMSNINELLQRAAEAAASEGVSSDEFVNSAWQAYLTANPGMREELEDKALRNELKKLRKRGLIASA